MIPLVLPARFSREEALQRLRRRRLSNLYGLMLPRAANSALDGTPSSIELIWLPAHAFRVRLSEREKQSEIWVTVDATYGGFALFGRVDQLTAEEPEGEIFAPRHTLAECETLAREGLIRYLLRRRGRKPSVESISDSRNYYSPVWSYYFRRGRKLDLAVLDAYTGEPAGGRLRQAVINGLIAKKKEGAAAEVSTCP